MPAPARENDYTLLKLACSSCFLARALKKFPFLHSSSCFAGYFKVKKKKANCKAFPWCAWLSPQGCCKRMSTSLLQGDVQSRSKGFSVGGKALGTSLGVVVNNALALMTILTSQNKYLPRVIENRLEGHLFLHSRLA